MKNKKNLNKIITDIVLTGLISIIPFQLDNITKEVIKNRSLFNNKISYKTNDFSKDSDKILLARMIFGEARWEPQLEKIAIAHTALNRAYDGQSWNGEGLKETILKPNQYSCFNKGTKDRWILKDPMKHYPKQFKECLILAKEILNGKHPDPTKGATFYYNPRQMRKRWKTPSWTKNLEKVGRLKIGINEKFKRPLYSSHVFYKEPGAKSRYFIWKIAQLLSI